MGNGMKGKRIAIGGSRKIEEISSLIEKQGGIPIVRPLQGTVFLAEKEVEPDLQKFVQEGADWVVFTTGTGLETLLNLSEKLGMKEKFLTSIQEAKIASRGYKTFAALKKLEIKPAVVDEDGTTRGLMRALQNVDFTGMKIMIQLHGETAPALTKFFEDKGATVLKILPYRHIAPEKVTVSKLCEELAGQKVDAVCFTTAVQVHSLFDFARKNGIYHDILRFFQTNVIAAAVGKVTAEALREEGVERLLIPENERMGAMIMELSRFYEDEIRASF